MISQFKKMAVLTAASLVIGGVPALASIPSVVAPGIAHAEWQGGMPAPAPEIKVPTAPNDCPNCGSPVHGGSQPEHPPVA
jgi:hypothetical protein